MSKGDAVVFVVDDDDAVRSAVTFRLRVEGYVVEPHASARGLFEALQAGRRSCCILLDLRMPDLDGLEAVRRLAALAAPPPVILMTGDLDAMTHAAAADAFALLEKPFDLARLVDCVQRALAQGAPGRRAEC